MHVTGDMDLLSLILAWAKSDFHGIISGNGQNSNTIVDITAFDVLLQYRG